MLAVDSSWLLHSATLFQSESDVNCSNSGVLGSNLGCPKLTVSGLLLVELHVGDQVVQPVGELPGIVVAPGTDPEVEDDGVEQLPRLLAKVLSDRRLDPICV